MKNLIVITIKLISLFIATALIVAFGLLLMSCSAWAVDTTLPFPSSASLGASGNTCAFSQNVTSGNTLLAFSHWESATSVTSVTDTRSTSYSVVLFDNDPNVKTAIYIGAAGGSGSNTVTFSVSGASFQQTFCVEIQGGTATVDATASGSFSGTPGTVTTSTATTTVGQDIVFCFIGGFNNGGVFGTNASSTLALGYRSGADSEMVAWKLAGSAGSYGCSFTNTNSSGSYIVAAIKPSASFAVATTALPDAAAGSFYTYTLQGMGGTGSYTCALTSGTFPVGLSLSGCTISGTPTAGAADSSLVFQLTDGSSTTASSGTLNLHLGASLQTLTLLQSIANTGGTGTRTFPSSVTAGSCIVVSASGQFYSLSPRDTLGTVFHPIASFYMSATGPALVETWAGKAPTGGSDTVTGNTGMAYTIKEYGNCQGDFADLGDVTTGTNTGAVTITSGTSTTLVPNTMVDALAGLFQTSATLTASSPLTGISATSNGVATLTDGYHSVSSAGSDTESFSKGITGDGRWGIILTGLRPSVTGTAPTAGGPRHHAQVY